MATIALCYPVTHVPCRDTWRVGIYEHPLVEFEVEVYFSKMTCFEFIRLYLYCLFIYHFFTYLSKNIYRALTQLSKSWDYREVSKRDMEINYSGNDRKVRKYKNYQ